MGPHLGFLATRRRMRVAVLFASLAVASAASMEVLRPEAVLRLRGGALKQAQSVPVEDSRISKEQVNAVAKRVGLGLATIYYRPMWWFLIEEHPVQWFRSPSVKAAQVEKGKEAVREVQQIVKAGLLGRIAADALTIIGLRNKLLFHGGKLAMAAVWALRTHRKVEAKESTKRAYVLPALATLYAMLITLGEPSAREYALTGRMIFENLLDRSFYPQ